jgi:hypothetical protein
MANVVKKHSISSELAQKMVDQRPLSIEFGAYAPILKALTGISGRSTSKAVGAAYSNEQIDRGTTIGDNSTGLQRQDW